MIPSDDLARQYPFPERSAFLGRLADPTASPALTPVPSTVQRPSRRAGEVLLTPGQKIALLKMRGSDWSKVVLRHLRAFGKDECAGGDYRALAQIGLATCKGSYHVLTAAGRWKADFYAMELARTEDLHIVSYDYGGPGRAACVKCTCGHRVFKSRAVPGWQTQLTVAAHAHLEHVGVAAEDR